MKNFWLVVMGVAMVMTGSVWAQRQVQSSGAPQFPDASMGASTRGADGTISSRNDLDVLKPSPRLEAQQARTRNADRQRRLKEDSDRLLSLATELKQTMGSGDKGAVSPDAATKAEEIERLAKSVRDKMKG